jgi:hypothetical protein
MVALESPTDNAGGGFFLTAYHPSDPLDHPLFQALLQPGSLTGRRSPMGRPVRRSMAARARCTVTAVGDLRVRGSLTQAERFFTKGQVC